MSRRFQVTVEVTNSLVVDVEAEDEAQAIMLAHFSADEAQGLVESGTWSAVEYADV